MRGVCPCDAIAAGSLTADKKTPPPVKKPVNLVWPLPPQKPRIKFVDYLANNTELEPPKQKGSLQKLINEDASSNVVGMNALMEDDAGHEQDGGNG